MSAIKDATGQAIWAAFNGKYGFEVVERDDGFVVGGTTSQYFSEFKDWLTHEKKAIKHAKGSVLDIGCGVGKHAIYLQNKKFDVTAIDVSPLAIKVCKKRGLKKSQVLSVVGVGNLKTKFDTVLLLGNNWGVLQNFKKAQKVLKDLHKITSANAIIIAESSDPTKQLDAEQVAYQKQNLKKGRMPGQRRIRIRFRNYCSDWFDYLGVSKTEMENIIKNTGWKVNKYFDSERSSFIAIIERE
ncbi:MAG: class I SAM-dependent methyltransferase [Patescibacteria group bacterium]